MAALAHAPPQRRRQVGLDQLLQRARSHLIGSPRRALSAANEAVAVADSDGDKEQRAWLYRACTGIRTPATAPPAPEPATAPSAPLPRPNAGALRSGDRGPGAPRQRPESGQGMPTSHTAKPPRRWSASAPSYSLKSYASPSSATRSTSTSSWCCCVSTARWLARRCSTPSAPSRVLLPNDWPARSTSAQIRRSSAPATRKSWIACANCATSWCGCIRV
jgi:hypothetical protein